MRKRRAIGLSLGLAGLCACSAENAGAAAPRGEAKEPKMSQSGAGGERQLPFAHGRTFASLDEYLAHLRDRAGPIGQPWYREVRPGVYERVTNRVPPPAPRTYTREELLARFGFSR